MTEQIMHAEKPSRRRYGILPLVLATFLIAAVFLTIWVVLGVRASFRAEENLHAARFAIRLVEQHVRAHRRWPRSWEELASVRGDAGPFYTGGMIGYVWPGDWPAAMPRL